MRVQLDSHNTQVVLTDEPWNRGIQRLVVRDREIPFPLPALNGHHFFTGVWPPPPNVVDYEPHESRASFAHAVHEAIEDDEVKRRTSLDW